MYHVKKSLPVYLYINLLFQIIVSLRGRSALDNFSQFENVIMAITKYIYVLTPENWDSISWHGMWNKLFKTINDKKFCSNEKLVNI